MESQTVPPVLVPIFNDCDFNLSNRPILLDQLRKRWNEIRSTSMTIYPDINSDPILTPNSPEDKEALLKRYLLAEEFDVTKAAERLLATLKFRKRFNFLQFYLPGAGSKTLTDSENPGAEAYFVDSCCVDKSGAPVLIGKMKLRSNDNMHPWAHLRAALFICERLQAKCLHPIQQASYILDISPCKPGVVGSFGPLGGDKTSPKYSKYNRTKEENASKDVARFVTSEDPSSVSSEEIESLLSEYGETAPGLKVLRIAMKVLQEHYPESLKKVVFVHSDVGF